MRLSVVLGFAACFLLPAQSQAGWGIFQSYVILDSGSGDQFLAGGINADGASAFAGTDLGDFTAADALTLNGGELKTYKNGSSNVCGGTLNYRVYASGETPGAFTALGLPFSANLSGSDQKWAATGQAIDLLDALIAGDYVLELYWEADGNNSNPSGCGQTQYINDSGNNFTATFSILSTAACPSSVNFDGYDYETVQIGEQCWIAENLRTTVYADGTAIPEVTASDAWTGLSTGARCNYDNDAINAMIYGRLYNWYAVNNESGLCPSGWHVPTDEEWTALETYLGANGHSGAEGTALKSTSGWNLTGGGTDNFGFSALPGGRRDDYYGSFNHDGYDGWWWSSSPYSSPTSTGSGAAWVRNLAFNLPHIFRTYGSPRSGASVRCLRDADQTEPQGCTDPGYIEYDASATTDDGSCATLMVEGCTDSGYTEYDPSANVDDGSCATLVVEGCTDSDYTEYDPSANVDDGSCATLVVEGCTDANYTEYDASANTDDGSCATLLGCTNSDMASMDGYNYGLTTIGDQCWFAENLRTTLYADGTAIPELTDHTEWAATSTGARCDYDNVPLNVANYGRLYNWHAATDASGLCPSGWHVPTDGEWTGLEDYITSQGFDGTEGTALKSTSGWSAGNGTDDFGFAALPGGRRNNGDFNSFTGIGSIGRWWSSSPDGSDAWSRNMNQNPGISRGSTDPGKGFSIRCLRNADHIESQGCTDPAYLEFDASANVDDNSCATLVVEGCMDPAYTEYDASANTDDGSCATLVVEGCTDPAYTEYDASANTDDGSCATLVVEGCTDPAYTEYNASANTDDGSCATLVVEGCMDPDACNYDDTATIDDGSCESLSCAGCTDPAYTEYDASATLDDGSCQTLADPCITAITPSFALDFGQPDNDLSTGDDENSTVALPFAFDFSGTAYSSVTISSNGVLNFGPSGDDGYSTLALEDYGTNIILGAHHDLNPSISASSLISYGVNGTAPNRAFVASWRGIPSYSDNNLLHNFQIVLYESGNVIEIWNGGHPFIPFGYITIGIAREDGTGIGPSNYNDEPLAAGKWSFTPDGSGGHVQAQSSNSALSLESIVTETPATTVDGTDGQATLLVNSGDPTSLTLTGFNGAGDYSFAQPGSIDGVAPGLYSVTAIDANGCTSNALTLIMTYALCCDCGVSDMDTDGICDDADNCTDKTATNYADPANGTCTY